MRFVIRIFDDADLAFRVFGAELRTVLSTTTVLADKPLRLSGRAIAQRFSALALLGRRLPSTWMASAFRRPRNLHSKPHLSRGSVHVGGLVWAFEIVEIRCRTGESSTE